MTEHHQHRRFKAVRYIPPIVGPTGPTADSYRIAGYIKELIGAKEPECDLIAPRYDSGLDPLASLTIASV